MGTGTVIYTPDEVVAARALVSRYTAANPGLKPSKHDEEREAEYVETATQMDAMWKKAEAAPRGDIIASLSSAMVGIVGAIKTLDDEKGGDTQMDEALEADKATLWVALRIVVDYLKGQVHFKISDEGSQE